MPVAILQYKTVVTEGADPFVEVGILFKNASRTQGSVTFSVTNQSTAVRNIDFTGDDGEVFYNFEFDGNGDVYLPLTQFGLINDLADENNESIVVQVTAPGWTFETGTNTTTANITLQDNDFVGTSGNDTIVGTDSADQIYGGGGNDVLHGGRGNDMIFGESGNNTLYGGDGDDTLSGGEGDDVFYVESSGDVVNSFGGNDLIWTSVSYDLEVRPAEWADGREHTERVGVVDRFSTYGINLTGNRLNNEIWGNDGANLLDGDAGADTMFGYAGNDTYVIESAGDVVVEYAGGGTSDLILTNMSYTLGEHVERLAVHAPNSTTAINLTGNNGANELTGNAGSNIIDGRGGADLMTGYGGNDFYFVDNIADQILETFSGGSDFVYASINYTLSDDIERLSTADNSGTAALSLTGNARVNEISGNSGANILDGRGGSDILYGLGGADTFAFTTSIFTGSIDQLPDFLPSVDKIALDDAEFQGLSLGSLSADQFTIGTAAQDQADRIIYNSVTGALFFDADGTGSTAAVQFATLHEGLNLSSADFFVI
jgi:Ca2+-binding RTX toxin-like protein